MRLDRYDIGMMDRKFHVQCELNGVRMDYDFCGDDSLEEEKESYPNAEYIGSSHVIYVNGVRNEWEKLHHFFKKK